MKGLSDSLLGSSGADSPVPRWLWLRRFAVALAGVSSVCLAFNIGAGFGRNTPHETVAAAAPLTFNSSASMLRGGPTNLVEGFESSCYSFTGITCENVDCGAERHASCRGEKCLCVGSCAGVDNKCYSSDYTAVASGFALYNAKYNWQHMYMPPLDVFHSIKTSLSPPVFDTDKWTLYEIPGATEKKAYFLSSVAFPEWVVNIQPTTLTAFSLFGAYGASLVKEGSPEWYAVRICSLGDGKIKIGSYKEPTYWLYIHHGSWIVYGWGITNDPGDGGYWLPDPPIPEEKLEPCA